MSNIFLPSMKNNGLNDIGYFFQTWINFIDKQWKSDHFGHDQSFNKQILEVWSLTYSNLTIGNSQT